MKYPILKISALIIVFIALIVSLIYYERFKKSVVFAFPYTQSAKILPIKTLPPLKQYPSDLINMVLAIEDQKFFSHHGIDFVQIITVISDYLFYNKPLRGASTISQQLIKNGILSHKKTLKRKIKESVMTLILEYHFSKEAILENYLHIVYLGQDQKGGIYGFINAAHYYFNKDIAALNLEEMAQLVALLKGASYYHPIYHKARLEKRKKLVLKIFKQYQKYDNKYSSN